MDNQQPNGLLPTVNLIPATNDELLHALRSTVVVQGATIKAMHAVMLQIFAQMKEIPHDEALTLFDKMFDKAASLSVTQLNEAIEARRKEVNNSLFQ